MRAKLLMLLPFILVTGCGKQVFTELEPFKQAYYAPGSGSVVQKNYGPITWTCKLVPRELDAMESSVRHLTLPKEEASTKGPQQTLHFILHVGPADPTIGDVMFFGVKDESEYNERMIELNFHLKDHILLKAEGKEIQPVFVHMENTYGISNGRELHVIFSGPNVQRPLHELGDLDLVLEDLVFATGISHFRYSRTTLEALPSLSL